MGSRPYTSQPAWLHAARTLASWSMSLSSCPPSMDDGRSLRALGHVMSGTLDVSLTVRGARSQLLAG